MIYKAPKIPAGVDPAAFYDGAYRDARPDEVPATTGEIRFVDPEHCQYLGSIPVSKEADLE